MLDIHLLGSPEILWNDTHIEIKRRIPRSMMYYLATFSAPVQRTTMMNIFWPDNDEHSAREAFRDNLSKLRKSMPDPEVIRANHLSVSLNLSLARVDYLEFQKYLTQIGQQPWLIPDDIPLPDSLLKLLVQAASLWRSPHLMDGAAIHGSPLLEEWLMILEQNSTHRRDRVYQRLIAHYLAMCDYESMLYWLEKALAADQINEDLHLLKLETLAKSGHRSEALNYAAFVQDLFQREYNEQPSNAFISAYQRIKNEQEQQNNTREITEKKLVTSNVPFVGRKTDLEEMNFAYQNGLVLTIDGDIGSGKTRLVQEFYRRLQPAPRLLVAPCNATISGIPYRPFIEMIRSGITPEELEQLPSNDHEWLSKIDPSFRLNGKESLAATRRKSIETLPWIPEAIYHLCQQVSASQKLLLLLENAESSDEATIRTLELMAENDFFGQQVSLVVTFDKAGRNKKLNHFLVELAQKNKLKRLTLEPLDPQEIRELVGMITAREENDEWIKYIEEHIGGNPLMIIETLRAAAFAPSGMDRLHYFSYVPGSIRGILRERYQDLTPAMQTLTSLAAISEPYVDYDILAQASQLSAAEVENALDELESSGILISHEDLAQHRLTYTFRQKIFREVVLMEMSATRKKLLHHRVGLALEKFHQTDLEVYYPILAEHNEAAGDLENAFQYWYKSAQYARQVGSPGDAEAIFQHANELMSTVEMQLTNQAIMDFYGNWADTAYLVKDTAALLQIYTKLLDLGGKRASPVLVGKGLAIQAKAFYQQDQFAEGLTAINQAVRYFDIRENIAEWLECQSQKSGLLQRQGRLQEACQTLEAALNVIPPEMDDATLRAKALVHYDCAVNLTLMGYPARGVAQAELSLQNFVRAHDMDDQARAYAILVLACGVCGDTVRADLEGQLGLQLAHRVQNVNAQIRMHTFLAMTSVCRGKMDDAWEHTRIGLENAEKYGYSELRNLLLRTRGDIFRYLGNDPMAIAYYRQAYEQSTENFSKCDSLARLGYTLCQVGELQTGLPMIQDARKISGRIGMGSVYINSQYYIWLAQKNLAGLQEIQSEVVSLTKESLSRGLLAPWGVGEGLLARLDYYQGRPDAARDRINNVLQRGAEFEGLWASLLFQLLYDRESSWEDLFYPEWQTRVREYMDQMDAGCRNPLLRESFEVFKDNVDKIIHLG